MSARFLALAAAVWLVGGSPAFAADPRPSGLQPQDAVEAWNPLHVAGPERGTNACPVCTYLEKPVVVVFAKDTPNTAALAAKLETLAAAERKAGLRVVVAVLDATPERLARLAGEIGIADAAFCYPNPKTRAKDLKAYRIDPAAENTVVVYKDYTVSATFTDLSAADFDRLAAAVAKLVP